MPVVACQECPARLKVPDHLIGRKIKCPKCTALFLAKAAPEGITRTKPASKPAPATAITPSKVRKPAFPPPDDEDPEAPRKRSRHREEEDEDEVPRRRKKKKKGGSPVLLYSLIGGGAALALIVLLVIFLWPSGAPKPVAQNSPEGGQQQQVVPTAPVAEKGILKDRHFFPDQTPVVVSGRPADFLASSALAAVRKELGGMEKVVLEGADRQLQQTVGLTMSEVVTVTVALAPLSELNSKPDFIVIAHTSKDLKQEDILTANKGRNFQTTTVGNYTLHAETRDAFCCVDSRTIILGPKVGLQAILQRNRPGELAPSMVKAVSSLAPATTLAVVVNTRDVFAALEKMPGGIQIKESDAPKELKQLELLVAEIGVNTDMSFKLSLTFPTTEAAKTVHDWGKGKLNELNQKVNDPGNGGAFREVSNILGSLQFQQQDAQVNLVLNFQPARLVQLALTVMPQGFGPGGAPRATPRPGVRKPMTPGP